MSGFADAWVRTLFRPQDVLLRPVEPCSPAGENDRLGAIVALSGNSSDMGEMGAPLAAVQPVLPELAN